jgi:arylsulfatase A
MRPPNIIIMLVDNAGYGDMGCYGSQCHRTPHIDQLSREGMRFTSFYSTSGVCTPSRASLMTGCYPRRVNLHVGGLGQAVLFPGDPKGLHPNEITLAQILKNSGYATACVGKWHLGDQRAFFPTRHGFDEFFGCPYSEDMVPSASRPHLPPLPIMRNETVYEVPGDRDTLTKRYTEFSVDFIRAQKDRPFLLYLAHAMPGSTDRPFASAAFRGRSANGPYGDAIEELDWSCGEIMATLRELEIDEQTVVLWTSDNGAVKWDPPQGSNAPLRGWGYDTSEGGQRMPCIVRWPGHVPRGTVEDRVTTMMDILPTATSICGGDLPSDRIIDGHDMIDMWFGQTDGESPYDKTGFFYYYMHQLQAVRSGKWKLYLPLERKLDNLTGNLELCSSSEAFLSNVREDPSENTDFSADYPDVVDRLMELAELAREDLGDSARPGAHQRKAGWIEHPLLVTDRLSD